MSEVGMNLRDLLDGFVDPAAIAAVDVSGLCLNSRDLRPGDVFVALSGRSGHGMKFVYQARERGAVAVLHDGRSAPPDDLGLPEIGMDRLAEILPALARRFWGEAVDSLDLLAVTGTNGKSSVAWLMAQALDGAMIGTLGRGRPGQHERGEMTTPDIFSVCRQLAGLAGQGIDRVVLEASSHALDQGRLDGLRFTSVIFTSLGQDHLDYHGDLASYAAAKARLFSDFESARQLINLDDDFGRTLFERLAQSTGRLGYAIDAEADARARLLSADRQGLVAAFDLPAGHLEAHTRLIGRINLYNLLIVAAELSARGETPDVIRARLEALEPVPGRMEPISTPDSALALIDYAHTPDALESALASARQLGDGPLWCVFGCGGDRDRGKRPLMGRAAERLADHIVLTDDNPRNEDGLAIIREIQAGMKQPQRTTVIRDRARAIAHALTEGGTDSIVLIAGKGHETDQVVGDRRLPCDDHDSVRHALGVAA
jgi:UDP-N-acetylmuramoyl-L-alanyl-D-glutamate--2,6-diaminopimelate ligase